MKLVKLLKIDLLCLLLSSLLLSILFLILPHYVELTGVMETWFMHHGLVYYKDFAAFHFPLGRLILYPLHIITNWNLEWDPFLGLGVGIINVLLIFLIGKKHLTPFATALSILFFSVFYWYFANGILFFHEELIGLLITSQLLIVLNILKYKKVSKLNLFILGLLISSAELSGQIATLTLVVIFFATCSLVFMYNNSRLNYILIFFLGLFIPILWICGYFAITGGLYEFYFYNIPYYLLYANYQKDSLLNLPFNDIFAFYIPSVILLINSIYLKRTVTAKTVFIVVLSLSTVPFIIFSFFHPHHINYALPILALALGFAWDSSTNSFSISQRIVLSLLIIFLLFHLFSNLLPWYTSRIISKNNFRIQNDLYQDTKDPMNDTVNWVKDNTQKEDKILVFGDAIFYLRADRLPSARPSKGLPYAWNPMSQISNEIENNKPQYWIIDRRLLNNMNSYFNRKDVYLFMNGQLSDNYIQIKTLDNWEIWKFAE